MRRADLLDAGADHARRPPHRTRSGDNAAPTKGRRPGRPMFRASLVSRPSPSNVAGLGSSTTGVTGQRTATVIRAAARPAAQPRPRATNVRRGRTALCASRRAIAHPACRAALSQLQLRPRRRLRRVPCDLRVGDNSAGRTRGRTRGRTFRWYGYGHAATAWGARPANDQLLRHHCAGSTHLAKLEVEGSNPLSSA